MIHMIDLIQTNAPGQTASLPKSIGINAKTAGLFTRQQIILSARQ